MKCIILAGGSGNRLWPLSRNNYPKQFINIKNNHSLLQETVVRNMPFCDEFLIVTNKKYNFIVENQMRVFQGLKYRCIYEEEARKTAPAIICAAMLCNPSEILLVVTADHLIWGEKYRESLVKAKSLIKSGALVLFGIKAQSAHTGYGYIGYDSDSVTEFHEKPDVEDAERYAKSERYLWNSGIYMFYAGDFLNEIRKYAPKMYDACMDVMRRVVRRGHEITLPQEWMKEIPAGNLEPVLVEKSQNFKVVKSEFGWVDVSELESLDDYAAVEDHENVIRNNSSNTMVINRSDDKLVVVNDLIDAVVVNTEDAVYISHKGSAFQIKGIVKENYEKYEKFFEDNVLRYRAWGTYEILKDTPHYRVKKVTVYPGKALSLHKHCHRSEHWSIVSGIATIVLENEANQYMRGTSVDVPVGTLHQVFNDGEEPLVIIEVAIGEKVEETDMISYPSSNGARRKDEEIVKLFPAFKDYLWGGTKLRDQFKKDCDYDIIAESWELSAHPDGESVIVNGNFKGRLFSDYLRSISADALGWKCKSFDAFPILIKFIDAKQRLSVQVHPDDDYAMTHEHEYGKNEMWYIMDCDEGATIFYGFKRAVTPTEVRMHINNNTLTELLNEVPVHKGDVFFVEAGTVHAIGAGVMVCEIQQSSNSTYRLYDYGRVDKYGNLRELHIEKALDVLDFSEMENMEGTSSQTEIHNGYSVQLLGKCKYFECIKYDVNDSAEILVDESSFVAITVLEGMGTIIGNTRKGCITYQKGDTFFIPAGSGKVKVDGQSVFILTHV